MDKDDAIKIMLAERVVSDEYYEQGSSTEPEEETSDNRKKVLHTVLTNKQLYDEPESEEESDEYFLMGLQMTTACPLTGTG